MLEKIAQYFASLLINYKIVENNDINIYIYGLKNFFNHVMNFVIVVLIGIASRKLDIVLIFLGAFIPLRIFLGGLHLKRVCTCNILSNTLIVLAVLFSHTRFNITYLYVISFIILFFTSPIESENKPIKKTDKLIFQKKARLFLGYSSLMYIILYINGKFHYANTIFFAVFCLSFGILLEKIVRIAKSRSMERQPQNRLIE